MRLSYVLVSHGPCVNHVTFVFFSQKYHFGKVPTVGETKHHNVARRPDRAGAGTGELSRGARVLATAQLCAGLRC